MFALLGIFGPLQVLLRVIAVAGGAVVGALVSGLLFSLIARIVFKQRPPRAVKRFVQVLGAIALGLALWKMPLGLGGGGEGWGIGFGLGGDQTGKGPSESASPSERSQAENHPPASAESSPPRSEAETLRIEMLGGQRVQNKRFYLLEGDNEPKTSAELHKAIEARQKQDKPPLKGIEIIINEHSVAHDHPAVRDLEGWARDHDLKVALVTK
jgi:hypothetical protein